jgi:transposase
MDLHRKLNALNEDILSLERRISAFVRQSEAMQRLHQANGIGEITASAMVATVGNAAEFKNSRRLAAWLGLVPRQYTTGGKIRLGRIQRRAINTFERS